MTQSASHSVPPGTPPDGRDALVSHATWNAICALIHLGSTDRWTAEDEFDDQCLYHAACDWGLTEANQAQSYAWWPLLAAWKLSDGRSEPPSLERPALPTCPTCLMFIDEALSIRAAADAVRVNDELNAERKP